jgi:hypothetical protein
VVPNEVLAAIQQRYCPRASKDIGDLIVENASTNYCTYDDLLARKIPLSTVLLVDEIDSLFFSDTPVLTNGRFLSAILLLNKH